MKLLAIDPGPIHSAYVLVETDQLAPKWFDKIPNEELLDLRWLVLADAVAIEQIGHYGTGMPAGQTVFDTCVWIGRYIQARHNDNVLLVPRRDVKLHLCGSAKATDGNVIQALVDRFAPNERNHGKGVKNQPGWFYGFYADIWQSYALAVYVADTKYSKK